MTGDGGLGPARRWLAPVGVAVIALVVAATATGDVGFGLTGRALAVTAALAAYASCALAFVLVASAATPVAIALMLATAAGAVALHLADPHGPVVGLYLVMAFAPLRVPTRPAALVAVAGVVGFEVAAVPSAASPVPLALAVAGGAAFFFLFGLLLQREKASAAAAERAAVARELHDVLAHTLSGLTVQLGAARLLARATDADAELTAALDRAHGLAQNGLTEAREAVLALRGSSTTPGPEAIAALVEEQRQLPGAGRYDFTVDGAPLELPAPARLAIYRTAQEALSNVRKHAVGADVTVRLRWDESAAELAVRDNGGARRGPLARTGAGYGLIGMRERVELLGGHLQAGPTDTGYEVALVVPAQREGRS